MFRMTSLLGCLLLLTIAVGTPSALAVNKVLSLDGSGDYVALDANQNDIGGTSSKGITVEAWIKPGVGASSQYNIIASIDRSEYWRFGYGLSGDKLKSTNKVGWATTSSSKVTNDMIGNTILQEGRWYHVVGVYEPSTGEKRIYVNGELDKSVNSYSPGTTLGTGVTRYGFIGTGSEANTFDGDKSPTNWFSGVIDEVRIWHIARTQKEIQTTMNKKLRGDETELVGYWNFDDGTANDLSKYGNNGTLRGNAQIVESDLPLWLPTIMSIAPNYGSVSGGTKVIVKGYEFQEGATVSIGGSELVDVKVFPEVVASTTSQSIDITDATPDDVILRINLKEKFTPEVAGTIKFPTDSTVIANTLVLKAFIETSIASSSELAGKIIVSVNETNSAVTFTTVDKGTGVQLSVEQTSGSDVLFKTVVGDKGHSEIIGTTSPGTVGLHDVVVTNPSGGSDTLVRGFAYMSGDCKPCEPCEPLLEVKTNTLAITGTVYRETKEVAEDDLSVEVNIITQDLTEISTTGTAGKGQYSVTFLDMQKPVAKAGDEILVTVKDAQGKLVGQSRYTLTAAEVEANVTKVDVTPTKAIDIKPVTAILTLRKGINVISVPTKADKDLRMSDLAQNIGKDNLTMIIRYDYAQGKFVSYLPTFPDASPANTTVKPNEGYIVVMKAEKEVEFEGTTASEKDNENASPSLMPMMLSDTQGTSIFVITGNVRREETGKALNEVAVRIRNLRTGQTVEDVAGTLAGYGNYVATFVASSEEFITHTMDELEITAMDKDNRFVITPVTHTLTTHDISDYVLVMPLHLSLPKQSALLQNYPNPFNPETWLPYQLAQDANVTVSIYNLNGQLVRSLLLGNQSAGVYVMKHKAAYWDGRDSLGQSVSSGVYFYTLQAGRFGDTRKMVILK
ncbi:T9SS type A sorting domain-containing protein [bacterium]|nr:T9SS type A sorting domain-containing protein [bacterium]